MRALGRAHDHNAYDPSRNDHTLLAWRKAGIFGLKIGMPGSWGKNGVVGRYGTRVCKVSLSCTLLSSSHKLD